MGNTPGSLSRNSSYTNDGTMDTNHNATTHNSNNNNVNTNTNPTTANTTSNTSNTTNTTNNINQNNPPNSPRTIPSYRANNTLTIETNNNNNNNTTIPSTPTTPPSTSSTPNSFSEAEMRKKIMAIYSDTSLSNEERVKRRQLLLTPKAFETPVVQPKADSSELEATYFDKENGILGCMHYRRACKLKAACCGRLVTCRLCHDDESDHQIVRFNTKEVMCMECKLVQPVAYKCSNCDKVFARYFCAYCKFYDDTPGKDIFHCPHCKICRIGKGLEIDFRHCHKCNGCLALRYFDTHICMENKFDSNCPICSQNMFNSIQQITMMDCGHGIHKKCLSEYAKTNYKCPLCSKSLLAKADMVIWWNALDREIRLQPMPAEFKTHIMYILCNDCGAKTYTPFHFVGGKCGECGGYCTSVIRKEVTDPATLSLASNHLVRYSDDPRVMEELMRGHVEDAHESEDEDEEEAQT
eukprot:Phypoly_transcript_06268.p1 GENE.Phypoly_transcript_06268~~Phypoly_transcript_06268.p1  ORF type:complete len:467 (+),score=58.16 Phypoly_transcript_06268:161-1561(+)